jgi:Tfp pilus assembly protein PilV
MIKHIKFQSGQTLIETIAAIFILTMALTAGLGLTIYVLSHSKTTLDEIVATNLAREGIDVVKNMRDTNWLESDAKAVAPWDLQDCTLNGKTVQCYPRVWEGGFRKRLS